MKSLKALFLDQLYLLCEYIKGPSTVVQLKRSCPLDPHLSGYSISGYEIKLFCQKKQYHRKYWWWLFTPKIYTSYRVFSVVSSDAPTVLRNACELDLDIPSMVPVFVSEHLQRKQAIEAYLDILIDQLKAKQEFSLPEAIV